MPLANARYEDLIFINCPFDASYIPMFRAIIFAVYRCGFTPISALSLDNGLQNRLTKIQEAILSAKYGIHDISNTKLNPKKLPRFNMPFELGLFYGAQYYGPKKQKEKNAIIFDTKPYRYLEFVSDLKGVDIRAHQNKPDTVIHLIRDWLTSATNNKGYPGEKLLIKEYIEFKKSIRISAIKLGYSI